MSQQSEEVSFGSDSFLDVMANMVGILIILVTIAVMHASRSRSAPQPAPQAEDLSGLAQQADSLQQAARNLTAQAQELDRQAAGRQSQYDQLAARLSGRQQDLAARREKLGLRLREKHSLRLALVTSRAALDEIETEVARKKELSATKPTTIECYPTPISHSVSGREIHFRLNGSRIAYVPMEELMGMFEREAKARVELLRSRPVVTGMLGPEGDFRMRYKLERESLPGGGFKAEATFTYIPVDAHIGETLQEAMAPDSELQEILGKVHVRQTTITLWAYPDSFALYRELKKQLYGRGFSVAGRPLENGQPIGASTMGTRSAAQ
jgi:hypothetical protein